MLSRCPARQKPFTSTARHAPRRLVVGCSGHASVAEVKQALQHSLQGLNRGIFGAKAAQRDEILGLVSQLEQQNTLLQPTENLQRLAGDWRLLYTTITITGSKRTKLGLREFVKLGEFRQRIDVKDKKAINEVDFRVTAFGTLTGMLSVVASYEVASPQRVSISFEGSTLEPQALQAIFQQNYALLLSIFNPDGWLDITYVDDQMRVGRDDKGNVFVLERM